MKGFGSALVTLLLCTSAQALPTGLAAELIIPATVSRTPTLPISFVIRNDRPSSFEGAVSECTVDYRLVNQRTGREIWRFRSPNMGCKTVLGPHVDLSPYSAGEVYRQMLHIGATATHAPAALRPGAYRLTGSLTITGKTPMFRAQTLHSRPANFVVR